MRDTDLAWIAGYVDGDGCIYLGKKRTYHDWYVSVASTNREPLQKIQGILSCGSIIWDTGKRRVPYIPVGKVVISGSKAIEVAHLLHPYLFTKKRQAEILMEFGVLPSAGRCGRYKRMPEELKNSRDLLCKQMKDAKGSVGTEPLPHTEQLSDIDWAWAAGLFDAEGSVSITKTGHNEYSNHYQVVAQLGMSHMATVYRVSHMAGVGCISKTNSPNRRPYWRFACRALGGMRFLENISAFSVTKSAQIDLAKRFQELPRGFTGREVPIDIISQRIDIQQQLQELNSGKGKR